MARTIFHVDMDAFYASIEQRDHPAYRGKPVIVGADPQNGAGRGVVAACSYEARRFQIHSAMPIGRAFRLCPRGIYLRPDFPRYRKVSRRLRDRFREVTDLVEPISIDEAFLDVSSAVANWEEAARLARTLKQRIKHDFGLTASIGIGPSKLVAKIASDLNKPDGLLMVREEEVAAFLAPLPISRLWGVGPKTAEKLHRLDIQTIGQLRGIDRPQLSRLLGKFGQELWRLCRGIDQRSVVPSRPAKSVSQETTFSEDTNERAVLEGTLNNLCRNLGKWLDRKNLCGRTVTLKLRYSDFTTITRQKTFDEAVSRAAEILPIASALLWKNWDPLRKVRLLGVAVSTLQRPGEEGGSRQLRLF